MYTSRIGKDINVDVIRQKRPYIIYQNIQLSRFPYLFFYEIDPGHDYILRSIYYEHQLALRNPPVAKLDLNIELVRFEESRVRQNQPYPARLVSTPGESATMGKGVVFDTIRFNESYLWKENLYIRFSWPEELPLLENEKIPVNVVMAGDLIPELKQVRY